MCRPGAARRCVDADGDKIGTSQDVFLDRQTGEPEWATVQTGLFGLRSGFLPITDAELVVDDSDRRRCLADAGVAR
jgi:hypothetical protein